MTNDSLPPMEIFEAIKLYFEHVDQKFTEIIQELADFKHQVTERFDRLEQKITTIELRLEKLEHRVSSLETKVQAIEEKMSTLVTKQQLNRLLLILETRFLLSPQESEFVRQ